jgi:hypothetical protein
MVAFGTRRIAYYFLTAYVCVACVHTFVKLLSLSISSLAHPRTLASTPNAGAASDTWGNDTVLWSPSRSALYRQSGQSGHSTAESLFLSKAFDHSMQPSRVVPFYFRAVGSGGQSRFSREDITILTIVTSNRFSVLGLLAQSYRG